MLGSSGSFDRFLQLYVPPNFVQEHSSFVVCIYFLLLLWFSSISPVNLLPANCTTSFKFPTGNIYNRAFQWVRLTDRRFTMSIWTTRLDHNYSHLVTKASNKNVLVNVPIQGIEIMLKGTKTICKRLKFFNYSEDNGYKITENIRSGFTKALSGSSTLLLERLQD
jgi:hypothetical protein